MDSAIILLSSDSSGPPSPVQGVASSSNTETDNAQIPDGRSSTTLFKNIDSSVGTPVEQMSDSSKLFSWKVHKAHQLSDSEESESETQTCNVYQQNRANAADQFSSITSDRSDQNLLLKTKGNRRVKTNEEKERMKLEKMQNREKKRAEQAQSKALKQAAVGVYRSQKPGECLKYIQVCLDQQLLTAEYSGELLIALQSAELQYKIQSHPVPQSVLWRRTVQEHCVGDNMKVQVKSHEKEEEEVVVVWPWDEVVGLIHSNTLTNQMQTLQASLPGHKFTLLIYGAEKYFRYHKTAKRREVREQVLGPEGKVKPNKKEACFENAPYVSEDEWETAVTELQLFANCAHRLIDDPQALASFIKQFTKAIAEAPFKHEKYKREREKLQWYAAGDSRDCVRVDKNGNGLFRLWEQQLCQFSRVGMETAQAIASVYRSPTSLVQAYENCSSEREAELLLEAIPVRRGVGPLTTVKRVGPDLSKRLYTFFTALDGQAALSQDE